MSRKVTVEITAQLTISVNEGVKVNEVLDEINYSFGFEPKEDRATIEDTEIINYTITNSR